MHYDGAIKDFKVYVCFLFGEPFKFHILVLNVKRREVVLLGTKPFLRCRGACPKPTEVAQSFCIKNEDPDFLVKICIGEGISNDAFFDSCVPAFSVSDEMYKSQHF